MFITCILTPLDYNLKASLSVFLISIGNPCVPTPKP